MTRFLITGASKGLGRAIALFLANSKASVTLHYRNHHQETEELAKECRGYGVSAETIYGDFSTRKGLFDFIEEHSRRFERISGLINNVGPYLVKPLSQTSIEEWESLLHLNVTVPFELSKAFLQGLIQEKGTIVNIGVAGLEKRAANSYCPAYMAAKEALLGLTRSIAFEVASSGVTVNMISPGVLEGSVDLPLFVDKTPLKKPILYQDICAAIGYLIKARSVTGQHIEIAGGFGLK